VTLDDLQKQLRLHIRARIGRGQLTGIGLARAADFPQGHLSNFLNARRGLSLESMDRLLNTLGIGILDLIEQEQIQKHAELPAQEGIERIAMVAAENAVLARFAPEQILETRCFNKSFLRRLKPRYAEDRRDWLRFVLLKLKVQGVSLPALRTVSVILLIDRHYSSLDPYRRLQPNMYVVRREGRCMVGYVTAFDDYLLVRPRDAQAAIDILKIERGRRYSEYIVGRVCHMGLEV